MTDIKIIHTSIEEITFKEVSVVGEEKFDEARTNAFDAFCDTLKEPCPNLAESWRAEIGYPSRQETMDWFVGKPIRISTVIKRRTKLK